MKKILGIDLGVSSIGWSLINIDENSCDNNELLALGSRVIPLTTDETTGFTKGNGETACKQRTMKRSIRRGLDRYQQRRATLEKHFQNLNLVFDDSLNTLNPMQMWDLRARAATNGQKLTLAEIGKVISHINQRRGYKSAKGEAADNSKSEYLSAMSKRAREAKDLGLTPGQYFAKKLKESEYITKNGRIAYSFRIKDEVFPRKAYEDELHKILENQALFYPEIFTTQTNDLIFKTVFYQRPLKSCKHLVSICEFEAREYTDEKGNIIKSGPKVAPVTSPIAQVCRLWETINNIELKNYKNRSNKITVDDPSRLSKENKLNLYSYPISNEERQLIFDFLNTHERLKTSDLFKILGLKKDDGFSGGKMLSNGIKGNSTYVDLQKALSNELDINRFLRFDLRIIDSKHVNEETGEIYKTVSTEYLKEPLYQLWHTVYSIDDHDELKKVLENKFGITNDETVARLFALDFRGKGHSNKSAKFMCRLIPLLIHGLHYSEACEYLGLNHSGSITKEDNNKRELLSVLPLLNSGDLRQPVVEKILNQLIHQVNAIIAQYGQPDEIHVEMARELKQSKDERNESSARLRRLEAENKQISENISELGLRPSKNKIQKYRMWSESHGVCFYCGKTINVREFLLGIDSEKEHIIPRSLYFNDSFSNKVCSCRECNADKGQMTGYDFMKSKSPEAFNAYMDRIATLFNEYKSSKGKAGISKTKHDLLLTSRDEIPSDFIERDLRLTQYISRKAIEILRQCCREVLPTTGAVTGFFRHAWGYDDLLHDINLPVYRASGQTEIDQYEHKGQIRTRERIIGWNKRLDHRHHAIDALTIALTDRSHIQRLNTLNAKDEQNDTDRQNLEKWACKQPHFSFDTVKHQLEKTIISFKPGKKVATTSKRIVYKKGKYTVAQKGIIVPRGPLTEESVYGRIKSMKKDVPVKDAFSDWQNIVDNHIRQQVYERLVEFNFDHKQAAKSLKKNPILHSSGSPVIKVDMWQWQYVIKYKISQITTTNKDKIVDPKIREIVNCRFEEVGNNNLKFQQSVAVNPLFLDDEHNIPIKTVRCYTGISQSSVTTVQRTADNIPIGYAKGGNNHHIAIYMDSDGNMEEFVVPFWLAVKRKQHQLPVIVTDPQKLWNDIHNRENDLDQTLLMGLPLPDRRFLLSMQINEMFIIGLSDEEINGYLRNNDINALNNHIYRVQKLTSKIYEFKRHSCTLSDTTKELLENGNYIRIQSFGKLKELNPRKISVSRLGEISFI